MLNILKTINRIFILESNLRDSGGHPFQYVLSLLDFCKKHQIESYVVPNSNIDTNTLQLLPEVNRFFSQSSFDFDNSCKNSFVEEFWELFSYYRLSSNDLIIFTSCYTQELNGVGVCLKKFRTKHLPRIVFNFHQLFPPVTPSSITFSQEFQNLWKNRLGKSFLAFRDVGCSVSFWSTVSRYLNDDLRKISGQRIGRLPCLFYPPYPNRDSISPSLLKDKIVLAFWGDGREEKGLLLLLRMLCEQTLPEQLHFLIQVANPRGYAPSDATTLLELKEQLVNRPNVTIIDGFISLDEYRALLNSIDGMILPYHPQHYNRRTSMLYIEAVLSHKPVIVSEQTWLSEELLRGNGSGVSFHYIPSNISQTILNIFDAIVKLTNSIDKHVLVARERSKKYEEFYTVDTYMKKIFRHYEWVS